MERGRLHLFSCSNLKFVRCLFYFFKILINNKIIIKIIIFIIIIIIIMTIMIMIILTPPRTKSINVSCANLKFVRFLFLLL